MTGSFTFTGLPEIHFGPKTIDLLPGKIRKYGTRVLLVLGGRSFQESVHGDKLQQSLEENKIQYFVIHIDYEPTPQLIDQATGHYRNENVDVVVSIGGGSVMDAGKAISAMLTQDGSVVSFLEDVGNRKHDGRKVPFIALPTTSGTGSEVTKNAVICERGPTGYKKSLRHDNFIPDMAIVDPELTISCPGHITASSGLDAFSQLLESYTSTTATIITDSLAFTAIRCAARSVLNAYLDGQNINVRSDMAYTALISGITLANAGLGLIHGLASVISGLYDIPHGII